MELVRHGFVQSEWLFFRCNELTLKPLFVPRLVFSQSLISLDLIEDFLELSCRAEDDEKLSPYKGNLLNLKNTLLTFLFC